MKLKKEEVIELLLAMGFNKSAQDNGYSLFERRFLVIKILKDGYVLVKCSENNYGFSVFGKLDRLELMDVINFYERS